MKTYLESNVIIDKSFNIIDGSNVYGKSTGLTLPFRVTLEPRKPKQSFKEDNK